MSKFASRRTAPLIFAAGLVLGGIVAVTVAAAASSSPATYYGCLHKGTLSKVGTSMPTCPSGHKLISWNSVGPQGVPGNQGAKGDQGVQGATGSRGPAGATGAMGQPGPSTPDAMQGAPCTFDGQPSTAALTTNSVTGAISVTCTPVPLTATGTTVGGPITEMDVLSPTNVHLQGCLNVTTCSHQFTAGNSVEIYFQSGNNTTGGGSAFTLTCPTGWTTLAPTEQPGSVSGNWWAGNCNAASPTLSATAVATF